MVTLEVEYRSELRCILKDVGGDKDGDYAEDRYKKGAAKVPV